MTKFLLFVVVLAVIYMLLRASKRPKSPPRAKAPEESMAQCAHCGVHFPRIEAIDEAGEVYCCEDHRRLGVRK
jgi:uncharacterized protein